MSLRRLSPPEARQALADAGAFVPELEAIEEQSPREADRDLFGARLRKGGEFALDDVEVPPVWGRADEVAWPAGEPLLIVGPTGIGHTTLLQRLILARLGLREPILLGLPLQVDERPVLYVAADRPRQARRSLRRMVDADDRGILDERLVVHEGPPPFDMARQPEALAEWATQLGVGTVAIDALKDVAARISEDETGSGIVRAQNFLLAEGIEVVANHHGRKASKENPKPNTLADVYGSVWITAGAGSVLLLWGQSGNPIVELSQLKQAAGEVGPFRVSIEFSTGSLRIHQGTDALAILRAAPQGLVAKDLARFVYESDDDSAVEKARRKLEGFTRNGLAFRKDGDPIPGRGARRSPARYFAAVPREVQGPLE
jgi:hypothetical protein